MREAAKRGEPGAGEERVRAGGAVCAPVRLHDGGTGRRGAGAGERGLCRPPGEGGRGGGAPYRRRGVWTTRSSGARCASRWRPSPDPGSGRRRGKPGLSAAPLFARRALLRPLLETCGCRWYNGKKRLEAENHGGRYARAVPRAGGRVRLRKDPPHAHAGDLYRGGLAGALAGAGPGALRGRRRDGRGGRAHLGGRRARGGAGAARPRGADGRAARRGAARQRRQHRPGAAGHGRQDAPARRGGIGHDQRHHALCRLPRGAAVPGRGHGALHGRLRILRFPGPAGRHEDHLRGHAPGSGALLAGDPLQRAAEHGGRGPGRHAGQAHGPAGTGS